jgi:branched-chain amino acid transport system ATP-binding protein
MSTLDNIMTGRLLKMRRGLFWQALHIGPAAREESEHRAKVERIIDFLQLQAVRKMPVGSCPTACRNASSLAGHWRRSQICCCWTSRRGMNVEEKEDECAASSST